MIKINIISEKGNGKTSTCFLLGLNLSKTNNVAIINFDSISKDNEFIKKLSINKKILFNEKNLKIYKVKNNLDFIDLSSIESIFENIDLFLNQIKSFYDIILIDNLNLLNKKIISILNDSNYVICPFKIEKDIFKFKNKIINFFTENNIPIQNIKFLPLLTNDSYYNMKRILTLRKELSTTLFQTTIPFQEIRTFGEAIKNTNLLDWYNSLTEEIKNKLNLIK